MEILGDYKRLMLLRCWDDLPPIHRPELNSLESEYHLTGEETLIINYKLLEEKHLDRHAHGVVDLPDGGQTVESVSFHTNEKGKKAIINYTIPSELKAKKDLENQRFKDRKRRTETRILSWAAIAISIAGSIIIPIWTNAINHEMNAAVNDRINVVFDSLSAVKIRLEKITTTKNASATETDSHMNIWVNKTDSATTIKD